MEKKFHPFVGSYVYGVWVISQNRHYLWGKHFYWMCDCTSVQEVVEYNESILVVQRWAQELLGYNFTVIHRREKMMGDVDALTRRFEENFSVYLCVAKILRDKDELKFPDSYDDAAFVTKQPTWLKTCNDNIFIPVLTIQCIQNISQPTNIAPTVPPSKLLFIHLVASSLMLQTTTPQLLREFNDEIPSFKYLEAVGNLRVNVLCIDDVLGTSLLWSNTDSNPPLC